MTEEFEDPNLIENADHKSLPSISITPVASKMVPETCLILRELATNLTNFNQEMMSKIRNLIKAVCVENEKVPRPPNLLKDDKNFDEGHRLLKLDENYGKAFGVPSCFKFEDGQRALFMAQNLKTTTNAIHEVSVSLLK